jgi:hypothetical protein
MTTLKRPHGYLHGEPYLEHVCKWINVDEHVCFITMHMHVNGIGHMSGIFHSSHMSEANGLFISNTL